MTGCLGCPYSHKHGLKREFADMTKAQKNMWHTRIILQRNDINVTSVIGQKELENPIVDGRNIRLDILAESSNGKRYNIEVQRSNFGADEKRAQFHSSMVDARMLKEGQDFKELLDSYVIFITEETTSVMYYHPTQ